MGRRALAIRADAAPVVAAVDQTAAQLARLDILVKRSLLPLGRYGTPDDIAAMAPFLAADTGRFITAANILVDGGYGA